jgi:hypothetical protein
VGRELRCRWRQQRRREEAPAVDGGVGRELQRSVEEVLRWRRRRLIHRCEREREREREIGLGTGRRRSGWTGEDGVVKRIGPADMWVHV